MIRTDQMIRGADGVQIIQRRAIAGQQQMIAVVDRHADRRVVIGAATAAGEGGRFVHHHALARAVSFTAADRPARPAPMM